MPEIQCFAPFKKRYAKNIARMVYWYSFNATLGFVPSNHYARKDDNVFKLVMVRRTGPGE